MHAHRRDYQAAYAYFLRCISTDPDHADALYGPLPLARACTREQALLHPPLSCRFLHSGLSPPLSTLVSPLCCALQTD